MNLHRGRFQSSVDHGQHAVLNVLGWGLGQQQVHLLQEYQQDLHGTGSQFEKNNEIKAEGFGVLFYTWTKWEVEVKGGAVLCMALVQLRRHNKDTT